MMKLTDAPQGEIMRELALGLSPDFLSRFFPFDRIRPHVDLPESCLQVIRRLQSDGLLNIFAIAVFSDASTTGLFFLGFFIPMRQC